METHLTIKHLAGYLPYNIDVITNVFTVAITEKRKLSPFILGDFLERKGCIIKPILRPLSDLTKEIEHNDKTFVPAEYFWSIDLYDQQAFELYGTIPPYWKACMEVDIRDLDWGVIEKLYEWHFDIHGLIEKGLAIDINTLK